MTGLCIATMMSFAALERSAAGQEDADSPTVTAPLNAASNNSAPDGAADPADPAAADSIQSESSVEGSVASESASQSSSSHDPQMTRWQYYQEIAVPELPADDATRWLHLFLNREVFSQARGDLADLRLVDAQGNEIPFVLRVRREDIRDEAFEAKRFNEAVIGESTRELSLDLGDSPSEHDQLDVDTQGVEFRRLARLEGSDDGQEWRTLVEHPLTRVLTGIESSRSLESPGHPQTRISTGGESGHSYESRRLKYPPSRHRYLRLRVDADPLVDQKTPPTITSATAHRAVNMPGVSVEWPVSVGYRESTRTQGSVSSSWVLDLQGDQLPIDGVRIKFSDSDAEFARDYVIESAGRFKADTGYVFATNGVFRRMAGQEAQEFKVSFPVEQVTCRLRVNVIDYQNPSLNLESATAFTTARELIFAHDPQRQGPLRLYYGNPKAEPPHYDLERNLPLQLQPAPQTVELGGSQTNPSYVPEPPPLSERAPWLIYVVLTSACLMVGLILLDVGRKAVSEHDAARK